MKIDGSMLSAYAIGRPRPLGGEDNPSGGMNGGGGGSARNIPTVETSSALPSGLANALWLATLKQEKAERESESLLSEFKELSRMSPAERLRKEILEAMDLTEEGLAQMPPEQRAAVEEEIRRALKERLGIDEPRQADAGDDRSLMDVASA